MKLDNLSPLELECYEEWNSADEQGGDCQTFGFAWCAFHTYSDDSNYYTGGIVIIEDDQGFVNATTFEDREEYKARWEEIAKRTQTYTCGYCGNETDNSDELCDACDTADGERNRAIGEAQDALDIAMADDEGACKGCAVAYVNGVRCHEHGCPVFARIKTLKAHVDALEDE